MRSIGGSREPTEVFFYRRISSSLCQSGGSIQCWAFFSIDSISWSGLFQRLLQQSNRTWISDWIFHSKWLTDRVSHLHAKPQACLQCWSSWPCHTVLDQKYDAWVLLKILCWLRVDKASHDGLLYLESSEVDSTPLTDSISDRWISQWMLEADIQCYCNWYWFGLQWLSVLLSVNRPLRQWSKTSWCKSQLSDLSLPCILSSTRCLWERQAHRQVDTLHCGKLHSVEL